MNRIECKYNWLRIAFILIFSICLFFALNLEKASAITVVQTFSSDIVSKENKLNLSNANYSVSWGEVSHKTISTGGKTIFAVPIQSYDESFEINNPVSFIFTNIGEINDRQIDCRVDITSIRVSERKGSEEGERQDGYMGICSLSSSEFTFGVSIDEGAGYRASKEIDYTVTFLYHENMEVVNLPFFQMVRDLDERDEYYREGWAGKEGNAERYHVYHGNNLTIFDDKALAPQHGSSLPLTSGDDEMLLAGLYVTTIGGTISGTYYLGDCTNNLETYCQYSSRPKMNIKPVLTGEETFIYGKYLTYSTTFTMHKRFTNTIRLYSKFEYVHKIPEGFSYNRLNVYDEESGESLNQYGTVTYDRQTKTVKFVFRPYWLSLDYKFDGRNIRFDLRVYSGDFTGGTLETTNKATIVLEDDFAIDTNVQNLKVYKYPEIQIEKKIKKNLLDTQEHGAPIFIYKITEQNSGSNEYVLLDFNNEDEMYLWDFTQKDEYVIATSAIFRYRPYGDGEIGNYTAEEIDVSRFNNSSANMVQDGNYKKYSYATFDKSWQHYSHNSLMINRLFGGGPS